VEGPTSTREPEKVLGTIRTFPMAEISYLHSREVGSLRESQKHSNPHKQIRIDMSRERCDQRDQRAQRNGGKKNTHRSKSCCSPSSKDLTGHIAPEEGAEYVVLCLSRPIKVA